ncbi:E3 ubiquitin-protein ligase UPL1 [Zea mays]|uniref:HECT-type E3 ubiquitin transferase n=16 Tax=Zea mays TaxID=4577 RepID=A0A1D6IVR4_MAIZE|nr:E3 ubiquitin-protein ligase UPL1 [Zea mays]
METDVEGRDLVSAMDSSVDGSNDEQFSHLSIFHVMVLVHRTMENSETCRLFVEKGGLHALLTLLLRPSITQSSGGMPIALHSTMVFKGFTQHHSTPLARAFCSSLKEHLKSALKELDKVSNSFDMTKIEKGAIPSLFVVEFLLFLAASKDNRWMNALLSEFGDASREVLEDVGQVHREVLWKISLFEKNKIVAETSSSSSTSEAQQPDMSASDIGDSRYTSFRQYLDPILRRRGSGWNIESQVSDLINMYRDIGRAASDSQRVGSDRYSSLGLPSSSQDQFSSSSDANASTRSEEDKKKSEHSSCFDMMRSLSYHINHLFLELGKAMLFASRRENSPVNLSPAVISVANNIASIVLEHLNFEGHSVSFERDMTVTTKCRYLGKVVEFVDGMLLDRPESCNSIMVNSFYCRGVIQAILTTFQATSELLFTMSRPPSSPMETDSKTGKDGKEMDSSWIYGPLTSYGAIMDHLVTSSFILSSSTRQLLEQPIFNGSVRFPQDAETFMKLLQSKVLKTVLPIWAHPQFPECNIELISSVMSIMRHVCSGVEVKDTVGNGGARLAGPPPDESAISLIVEMGFSRARAEEALRQVGTNSVEIATDWLFAHPEEPQEEDDELARALAMSLGNSVTPAQEGDSRSNDLELEEATVQPPPIDEMLRSCLQLLQRKEALAFSVRDMLVTISSQNDGQNRVKVLTYLIDNLKQCVVASEPSNDTALSALLHVLALILHGDTAAREVASKAGLVKVALDLLCSWEVQIRESSMIEVPNWVISCFLSVDQMLQLEPKLPDVTELHVLKRDNSNIKTSLVIDDSKRKDSESLPNVGLLDMEDQFQLLKICCKCIGKQLPSASMHAILQLSATLTKVHAAAICFLESGGLNALLSLPTSSLFSGFNNMASTIIRHILEDPHTLQQAMELEIRHSLVTAANRHANPRVTPRNFIQNLAFVVYRDPVIFMKAAQSVCQIEMVGDRPYVVLLKDREKERIKEKDKDKSVDKDKATVAVTKVVSGDTAAGSPANSHGKQSDLNSRNVKSHRKPPQSFVTVIEHLLDLLMSFVPPPRPEDQVDVSGTALSSDMDIDCSSAKGKGKAVSVPPEESKHAIQESTASLAKTAFFLKLLTDVLLTYASSIHVVLRHDAELSNMHGPNRTSARLTSGGIFNHILQHFLPHATRQKKERKNDGDWMYKLATRANQFLVASSIRSAEARKRIFSEICSIFLDFTDSSAGYNAPVPRMNVYVDLLNDILSARSPTGSSLSAESAVIFVEAGLVHSLSTMLQVLDLDHPDSAKIVTAVVKALELVSKEHIHSADNAKGVNSSKIASDSNNVNSSSNRFQALDMTSQPTEMVTDHRETFNAVRTSQISDSVADEMDHDRDMDGGFARDGEDDFMHEMAEDGTGDGSTMEIRIEIPRNREDDMAPAADDTDEDISAEDGEDDEDEDEENNNLEEDDAHRMSHPDTDQEDREMDEEEFDEDLLEEDDEDEDEEGVILRLEEGINGINVLDHVEVFGGSNNLSGDTLRVMPLDIFGTRRQGRSTSIYNLLGRASDHGVLDHPLLEEPSSTTNFSDQGHPENLVEMAFSDRNHESSSSRLDAIFRSLRSGRNGHRFNMWLDDGPQRNGSAAPAVPEGIEELLISHLRRPTPQPDGQRTPVGGAQENDQPNHGSDAEAREVAPAQQNENSESTLNPLDLSECAGPAPPDSDALQRDVSNASELATEMQYERSDAITRDVEAVSQASSGSGATLGESLRSLEVEIGSVEGHDDGDRHGTSGTSERLPLGDIQAAARSRRPSGNAVPVSSRDMSLESVSEVPQNPDQEPDQNASEGNQEPTRAAGADSIDPTFLEALPEDLRAEVLSSRQNQVTQTSNDQPQDDGDIDPEFLAALPPDIREEVLAQQRTQRMQQQSQELEGQPVEMDAVSIIATFPSEIREEVLLTSPDTLLATLTPALVAEANMLRERFAHRYHSSSLFGMNSRNRRGESSRRDIMAAGLDRNTGDPSRSTSKPIETEGAPLVDEDGLKALIRLLRVVQPLYKGQLQKLLVNLCTHRGSRQALVQILVDMLMLDLQGFSKKSIDAPEPPFRLYGCHANIAYSRPQSSDGLPPLVSRRVLETLTNLARSHPNVAKLLLFLEFPCPSRCFPEAHDHRHGKAVLLDDGEEQKTFALVLLLNLLDQPLYMRSVAHLEQLLNLLDVVMHNAENEIKQAKLEASSEKPSAPDNAVQDGKNNSDISVSYGSELNPEDGSKAPAVDNRSNLQAVLRSLPQPELRLLCSLLAHDGLSDSAYLLVGEVLKKIVALAPFFCCHFINELARSMQNLTLRAMKELHLYENSEKALLSSSSANGTAVLRVVQALSSLVNTLQERKDPEQPAEKDHSDAVSQISEINTALDSLWLELSNCISKIESSSEYASNLSPASASAAMLTTGVAPPLPAGTQNLLPYIESFFVTCEKLRPGQPDAVQDASTSDMEDASTSSGGQRSSACQASLDEKQNAFVKFSEKHRRLLNAFIRQNSGLLEKSFSLMLKIPRLIDFDNKRAYFRSKIKHQYDHHHHSPVRISVRRPYILEDSYNQLRMRSPQDLKGRLTVQFQGEEGIDAGGLTREWYQSISRVIVDKSALLFTTVGNDLTFQPNPNSVYQTEHLSYFKFVGRVVGKALFDGQLLDAHFTRSFYKHILGVKVTYHDIEAIDPSYYKNLKWMLENDISDVLDLTFSMDADEEKLILYEKAEVTDCELIPGGRNIRVTEENKHEYVDRVAEHRLTTAIRPQINAFLEGFNELIPRELISIFNDKELELLISGLPDIDLDDLKTNTEYSGYSIASPVVQWFWEIVQGFSKEDKARFLQFVTGTSKVPLEGFSELQGISGPQRFQIHKAYGSTNHLPSAHTCFNQLDLPEYTSKEQLQERLLLAIHEANEGFGFG